MMGALLLQTKAPGDVPRLPLTHTSLNVSIILSDKFSRILKFVDERENKHLLFRLIDAEQEPVLPELLAVDDASKVFARLFVNDKKRGVCFQRVERKVKGVNQASCGGGGTEHVGDIGNGAVQACFRPFGEEDVIGHTSLESSRRPIWHRPLRLAGQTHSPRESLGVDHPTAAARSTLQSLMCSSPQNQADCLSTRGMGPLPGHKHRRAVLEPNVPKLEAPWFSPFTSLASVYAPCGQSPIVVDSLYGRSAA